MQAAGPDQSAARELVRQFEPVGYVYASLATSGEEERDVRWRALAAMLHEQGALDPVVAALAARFTAAQQAPARLAVFAAADGTVAYEQRLAPTEQPDIAGYAAPPAIMPLLAAGQEHPPYLLVVIDRTGADLSGSRGGDQPIRTWSVTGPDDEIERNAPGGWSQPRYQRRAEDSWKHNAKRVAEKVVARVGELGAQVLVTSGDVRAVQLLTAALPADPALVIGHISGSRALDGSQPDRASALSRVLREAAQTQTRLLLDQFHAHLEPGGLAVDGRTATIEALAGGRVAMLLVVDPPPGSERPVWFGPGATDVFVDGDAAGLSGRPVHAGRLDDVAVRAALLSHARARVIPAETSGAPTAGIGAICRYGTR
jgi:Bacterial archaeo-eukaryotic release factor family 2